jgi:hypothetical protein
MKKAELVNSLNIDSTENRDSSQFLSVLEGFIKKYPLLFSFCLAISILLPLLIDYCYRVLKEKKKK